MGARGNSKDFPRKLSLSFFPYVFVPLFLRSLAKTANGNGEKNNRVISMSIMA